MHTYEEQIKYKEQDLVNAEKRLSDSILEGFLPAVSIIKIEIKCIKKDIKELKSYGLVS